MLGVDAGERRVGLALSDETRLLATPLRVLDRKDGLAPVLDAIAEVVQREGVMHLIVGLPLNADGSVGRQAKRAQDFARVAERVVGRPVTLWDERLSTRAAEEIVRAQGQSPRRRKDIDAIAAAVILQDYLDHLRSAACPGSAEVGRNHPPFDQSSLWSPLAGERGE